MEKVVLVEVETMNKILGVLGSMPYNQIADLLAEIQAKTQVIDKPAEEADKGE